MQYIQKLGAGCSCPYTCDDERYDTLDRRHAGGGSSGSAEQGLMVGHHQLLEGPLGEPKEKP